MAQASPPGGAHNKRMKTPLLPALLLALSSPAAASGDAAFVAALADVQTITRAQAATVRASWNPSDWFRSDPVRPSRIPGVDAARRGPAHQDAVELDGKLYFLDGGRVFETVPGSGQAEHLSGSSKVTALVTYRGALVALRSSGKVYIWTPKRRWVDIGNSAASILVAGDDMLALTHSGEVWAYLGTPGPLDITYIFIPMQIGDVTVIQMYPVVNGHRVAFTDTGVRGVARLEPDGRGGARIVRRDGSSAPFVRGR